MDNAVRKFKLLKVDFTGLREHKFEHIADEIYCYTDANSSARTKNLVFCYFFCPAILIGVRDMLSSQVVSAYRDNASSWAVLGVHHSAKYSTTGILNLNIRVVVLKTLGFFLVLNSSLTHPIL